MKKFILTAALCTAMAAPALAGDSRMHDKAGYHGKDKHGYVVDKMLHRMDTNNNGRISMNEHEAFNARMFAKIDENNDRVLTRAEMMDYQYHKKGSWMKDGSGKDRYND